MLSAAPIFRWVSAILAVLAALGLAAGAAACGGSDPTPPPLSITAIELYSAKQGNAAHWNQNYVGQRALIAGEVTAIEKAGSKYDVKLVAEEKVTAITGTVNPFTNEYMGADVVCKVNESEANTVSQLQKGDQVTVLATISDSGIIDLVVQDCSVR